MDLYCLCEAFASTEAAKFLPLSFKAASDHFCLPGQNIHIQTSSDLR